MSKQEKPKKINWLRVQEPLRTDCVINTVDGLMRIKMIEPNPSVLDQIPVLWPEPPIPTVSRKIPVEENGKQLLKTIQEPDTRESVLAELDKERNKVNEYRLMAFVEAAIEEEDKPPYDDVKERVEFLMKMPKGVREKLIRTAAVLSETRLAERFEEAKKE